MSLILIISQKYNFIYFATVGHSASTSLYKTLLKYHDFEHVSHDAPTWQCFFDNTAKILRVNKHSTPDQCLNLFHQYLPQYLPYIYSLNSSSSIYASIRHPSIWWIAKIFKNTVLDPSSSNASQVEKIFLPYLRSPWVQGTMERFGMFESIYMNHYSCLPSLIRFENLDSDFRGFCSKHFLLNEFPNGLPHLQRNSSTVIDYNSFITESLESTIVSLFPSDFSHLGYHPLFQVRLASLCLITLHCLSHSLPFFGIPPLFMLFEYILLVLTIFFNYIHTICIGYLC